MLIPDQYTFIFVAVNLAVLYFFMRKILFKPVTEFMEKRRNAIEKSLDDAEQAKIEAAEIRKDYEEQIRNAKDECDKLLNAARVRANQEYEEIVEHAHKDALTILEKGREEIERERAEMLNQVRQQIAVLAIAAATQVVQSNMDSDINRNIVDKFIDEAGAA